jgi:alpha-maltose-1-phosphate synthase
VRVAISTIGRFHMFDLARQLRALGEDVRLFTGYPSVRVDTDLRPVTRSRPWWTLAAYVRTLMPPPVMGTWWAQHNLDDFGPWLARTLDPDRVDILDALAGTGLEAGRRLRRAGRPWICNRGSTHILAQKALLEEEHRRWSAPAPDFTRGIDRCLDEYAECDALIVPSRFVSRSFVEHGVAADKLHVCPYGVDLAMFAPQPKADDRFRAIFVGAYSLRKGIGDFFAAVRPFVTRRLCEAWLVGTPAPEARDVLARNADIARDQGVQPRARLAWYYSQASVLILPSIEEGLALVLAQAMACGVPVIASANTGADDLLEDGVEGFIVPARDPSAISRRLEWMLDNPHGRQRMAAAAQRRVRELGGWDAFARRSREVYRRVMSDTAVR